MKLFLLSVNFIERMRSQILSGLFLSDWGRNAVSR